MKILFVAAAAALVASAANATDLPPMAQQAAKRPAPVLYRWDGFYVGGNIGYSWGKWSSTGFVSNGAASPSVNGILGGLQLGYNWQTSNRWLFGLEADIQITDESKSISWVTPPVGVLAVFPGVAVTNKWEFPWFGTVRGRIGYAPDNWLIYFTGGLAYGETKSSLTIPTGVLSQSVTKAGWTIGGGVETAVTNNWTAKLEYLYVDLGSEIFFGTSTTPVNSKLRDNIVRFGVNYMFR